MEEKKKRTFAYDRERDEVEALEEMEQKYWGEQRFARTSVGFPSETLQHLSDDEYQKQLAIKQAEMDMKRKDAERRRKEAVDYLWK